MHSINEIKFEFCPILSVEYLNPLIIQYIGLKYDIVLQGSDSILTE